MVLIAVSLAVLEVRRYLLLTPVVLAVEFGAGGWLGSALPGHSDWRGLVMVGVLAIELLGCRLLSRRPR